MSDDEVQYVKRKKHLHFGEAQVLHSSDIVNLKLSIPILVPKISFSQLLFNCSVFNQEEQCCLNISLRHFFCTQIDTKYTLLILLREQFTHLMSPLIVRSYNLSIVNSMKKLIKTFKNRVKHDISSFVIISWLFFVGL